MEIDKLFTGTIKMYNGNFGFVESEFGNIYFHSSGIETIDKITRGDVVSFFIEKSTIKKDKSQAIKINLIEITAIQEPINTLIGYIDWYNNDRDFGLIKDFDNEYFFLSKSISDNVEYINSNDVCCFKSIPSPRKKDKLNAIEVYFIKNGSKCVDIKKRVINAFQSLGLIENDITFNFAQKILLGISHDFYPETINATEKYMLLLWRDSYTYNKNISFINMGSFQNEYKVLNLLSNNDIKSEEIINAISSIGYVNDNDRYHYVRSLISFLKEKNPGYRYEEINASDEFKLVLWKEQLIEDINLKKVAQKIYDDNHRMNLGELFSKIKECDQLQVLSELSSIIIESENLWNYLIQEISKNVEISEKAKDLFISKIRASRIDYYNKNNDDLKFNQIEFDKLSLIDKVKKIEKHTHVFKLNPNRGKYESYTLKEIISTKGFAYVNNNISIFPSEFENKISTFYYSKKVYNGYGWQLAYYSSKVYDSSNRLITDLIKEISENSILNYFQINTPKDLKKVISSIIEFKETKRIFEVHRDPQIWSTLESYLAKLIFEDTFNNFEYFLDKVKLIKTLDENLFQSFIENSYIQLHTIDKLRLWLFDFYGQFNYEEFTKYYFVLNKTERSIFNKKAKAIMGEELKQSMLKQREPWKLLENRENGELKYNATWRSIWFDDGKIKFCLDRDGNFSNSYQWDFAEEKFNLLFDYISGRSLNDLKVYYKNDIINRVKGLEELEEIIWKVQIQKEVETYGNIGITGNSYNKIPNNIILRNKSIQLLNGLQLDELEPTRVLERTFNIEKSSGTVDISLLYSIPITDDEIAIIWESLELEKSKATHIFKCFRKEYDEIFFKIESYLQSNSKVRSSLKSIVYEDVEHQRKLRYLCSINHDNFDYTKWEKSFFEILPELSISRK